MSSLLLTRSSLMQCIAALTLLVSCCALLVVAGPTPKLGGLPVVNYPKPIVEDCSLQTDCVSCASISNCAFCFSSVLSDPFTGAQTVAGSCADFSDMRATASCPGENRFYLPGMCLKPTNPGCIWTTDRICEIQNKYNDKNAETAKLKFGVIWLIVLLIACGILATLSFHPFFYPYYGRSMFSASFDADDLPNQLLLQIPTFALLLAAVALNDWSNANNEDGHHYYGPFGYILWHDKYRNHFYSCGSDWVNPTADLALCRALPASALVCAISVLLSLLVLFVRLIHQLVVACRDFEDMKPFDTRFWRWDALSSLLIALATLLWTSAHSIIGQTMIATPFPAAPHDSLHMGKSWILMICTSILSISATVLYGMIINRTDAPSGWISPSSAAASVSPSRSVVPARAASISPLHKSNPDQLSVIDMSPYLVPHDTTTTTNNGTNVAAQETPKADENNTQGAAHKQQEKHKGKQSHANKHHLSKKEKLEEVQRAVEMMEMKMDEEIPSAAATNNADDSSSSLPTLIAPSAIMASPSDDQQQQQQQQQYNSPAYNPELVQAPQQQVTINYSPAYTDAYAQAVQQQQSQQPQQQMEMAPQYPAATVAYSPGGLLVPLELQPPPPYTE